MKILIVVKQKKNVDTFLGTIRALLDRGHVVTLAVQERHDARIEQLAAGIASPRFSLAQSPSLRTDDWAEVAPLLRSLGDCLHYQQPELRGAVKLQARTIDKLREELRVGAGDQQVAEGLRLIPAQQIERLETVLDLAEQHLPTDPLYDEFLRTERPDVLLLSPVVHFGSAQADLVASARTLGIPVGMLLFSWDNLSTKGRLHRAPDWMFVWNDQQRTEAKALHSFSEDRIVIVGAPRFDAFFDLRPQMTRDDFLVPLGLDPQKPTLLYVCSSPFVSAEEITFVRKWLQALRTSATRFARDCNVIVRPHPDVALLTPDEAVEEMRWPALSGVKGLISRPFDDTRAIVLRTSDRALQGFYECIHHSAAVVGLNTSAELEAAIVGRPVYTVLAGEDADGQSGTLHFHYLLEEQGGCVRNARTLEEHVAQIEAELVSPSDAARIRRFVGEFLRPLGVEKPVSSLLAEAIERTFGSARNLEPAADDAGTNMSDDSAGDMFAIDEPPVSSAPRPVTTLTFGKDRASFQLYAPDPESGDRNRIDRTTLRWLLQHVAIGDVLGDVDAGTGMYSVVAAKYRGATVIAFEPGYAAFKQLCDNLLLNGCDGAVIPMAVALADFDGLGEIKFPRGLPGQRRHSIREAEWRQKRPAGEGRPLVQTVCVASLDNALERYSLPTPNHLRLGNIDSALQVLDGATALLASGSLKTIFLTLEAENCAKLAERLAPAGWAVTQHTEISRGRAHVLLSRNPT